MSIQVIIIVTLAAVSCCSCHPHTGTVTGLDPESIDGNHSVFKPNCITVAHREVHSVLRMRMGHLRGGEISLSPPPASPPDIKPDNSTKMNTTLPSQQTSPETSLWTTRLENIVTPVFRAVILILALFNVNITWRIHGQWLTVPCYSIDLSQS